MNANTSPTHYQYINYKSYQRICNCKIILLIMLGCRFQIVISTNTHIHTYFKYSYLMKMINRKQKYEYTMCDEN